jgi:hypothetical protein
MAMRKVTTTTAESLGGGEGRAREGRGGEGRRLKAEILQLMWGRQRKGNKGGGGWLYCLKMAVCL